MFGLLNNKKDDNKKLRSAKLNELKTAFPTIRATNREETELDYMFSVHGHFHILKITLSSDFPIATPGFIVVRGSDSAPKLTHPWLDNNNRVTTQCSSLQSWTKSSSLSTVVKEIVTALQQTNPTPINPQNNTALPNIYPMNSYNQQYHHHQQQQQQQQQQLPPPSYHSSIQSPAVMSPPPSYNQVMSNTNTYMPTSRSSDNLPPMMNGQQYIPPNMSTSNIFAPLDQNRNNLMTSSSSMYNHSQSVLPPQQQQQQQQQQRHSLNVPTPSLASNMMYPPPTTSSNNNTGNFQNASSYPSNASLASSIYAESPRDSIMIMPDVPSQFPILRSKTEFELESYIRSEAAFQKLLMSIESMESMTKLRDDLRESNKSLATSTIDNNKLGELREEVSNLKQVLDHQITAYRQKYDLLTSQYVMTHEAIIKNLRKEKDDIDNQSEELAQDFVYGKVDINTLLQEYMDQRKQYHSLNMKLELVTSSSVPVTARSSSYYHK